MQAKIVDLKTYRSQAIVRKSFGPWSRRFGESFSETTRLSDLSNATLFYLAQPGDNSTTAFYEVIMGVLDLGDTPHFYYLSKAEQLMVVDIHLFLADQIRFEMMRRLGWLEQFTSQAHPLIELIMDQKTIKADQIRHAPVLRRTYPEYPAYCALTDREKESFIRRLLPKALEEFQKHL
jgi:hypothetical protein